MSDPLTEIPTAHLDYTLDNGAIPAWLIAGPMATEQPDWAQLAPDDTREAIVREVIVRSDGDPEPEHGLVQPPIDWGQLGTPYDDDVRWKITRVGSDHLLDLATTVAQCRQLTAWAYAQLVVSNPGAATFTLLTYSPVAVWLNGAIIARSHRFYDGQPGKLVFTAPLIGGVNELLLRLQTVALGPTPFAFGVRVRADDTVGTLGVRLPTLVTPVERRQKLAALMHEAYLTRDVYVRKGKIDLWWSKSLSQVDKLTARLQTPQNRIVAEATPMVERGARVAYGEANDYRAGEYEVRLLPEQNEYYVDNMRVERRLPLAIAHAAHSATFYGDPESRRTELLREVAAGSDLWAALAKVALDESEQDADEAIDAAVDAALHDVLHATTQRHDSLVALIRLVARHGDRVAADKLNAVRGALRQAYGTNPALIPIHPAASETLLTEAIDYLIAEQLPNFRMDVSGRGQAVRALLQRYAAGEWTQVNNGEAMTQLFVALAHLFDLAGDADLADLAAVCLDKLCFELALNSYQGLPGGGQSASWTRRLQSGRLHPLSSVCRLLWGAGAFCAPFAPAMSVALAGDYTMPEIVMAAALDQTTDAWSQLRYGGPSVAEPTEQAIYRTPDYLLGSLVDFRPGEPGARETVVQAVLAPEAMISINHPGGASQHEAYGPNFWRGNGRLPRVGQWHDVAITLFDLPQDEAVEFTHAYFPLAVFDEVVDTGAWLCARKGEGYVALTAAHGLAHFETGPTALREVRSPGRRNVWIMHMGRAAVDGSFADFTAAVNQLRPHYQLDDKPSVQLTTLRGATPVMDWQNGLTVDGKAVALEKDVHVTSPYATAALPARHLDIKFKEYVLRLAFDATQADMA